jgi:hypothetical protein
MAEWLTYQHALKCLAVYANKFCLVRDSEVLIRTHKQYALAHFPSQSLRTNKEMIHLNGLQLLLWKLNVDERKKVHEYCVARWFGLARPAIRWTDFVPTTTRSGALQETLVMQRNPQEVGSSFWLVFGRSPFESRSRNWPSLPRYFVIFSAAQGKCRDSTWG